VPRASDSAGGKGFLTGPAWLTTWAAENQRRSASVEPVHTIAEDSMSDDKTKTGGQDRKRIDVNEDYELRDWSKKFGVTPEQLKAAVRSVGTSAEDVQKHLSQ
jgi:hypothetical protein